MVVRTLTLQAPGFEDLSLDSQEFAALQGTKGLALPPRSVRWWDGAGHGSTYRSSRLGRRVIGLPVLVQAPNADTLEDRLNALAARLAPEVGPVRLVMDEGEKGRWYTDCVLTGGGDLESGKDSNGHSWAQPVLQMESGDPLWTNVDPTTQTVRSGGLGRGLLKGVTSLTMLRLSSSQAMGTVTLENPGNADAYPVVLVQGPGTALTLTNSRGKTLSWAGVMTAGQFRVIDFRAGTIVDQAGVNRYDELGPAPQFWTVPPGTTTATVELTGATVDSLVQISWKPRKWVVS